MNKFIVTLPTGMFLDSVIKEHIFNYEIVNQTILNTPVINVVDLLLNAKGQEKFKEVLARDLITLVNNTPELMKVYTKYLVDHKILKETDKPLNSPLFKFYLDYVQEELNKPYTDIFGHSYESFYAYAEDPESVREFLIHG